MSSVDVPSEGQLSVVKSEFVYKWELNNFNVNNCAKTGDSLRSPVFHVGVFKWQIRLYPKGLREEFRDSLSVALYSLNYLDNVEIKYSLSILGHGDTKFVELEDTRMFNLHGNHGYLWGSIIKYNALMDSKNNLLPNNKLTIQCDIIMSRKENLMKLESFCKNGSSDFEKLLNNEKFSDVKFIVDGKNIYAHKNILANKSEVFAAMFEHDMMENLQNTVEIEDISYDVLNEMFRFIYSGKINNMKTTAGGLCVAAERYALQELKIICADYLCSSLSIYNCVKLLEFANTYNIDKLKTKALDFIVLHSKDIVNVPEFG